jgi:hypothetical protein
VLLDGFGGSTTWEPQYESVWNAAFEGYLHALEVLLDSGEPQFALHVTNWWGRAEIHAARHGGRLESVKFLLARSARSAILDRMGRKQTFATIICGEEACLPALLCGSAGKNVSCPFAGIYFLLLERAAYFNRLHAVVMLLQAQAGRSDPYFGQVRLSVG